MLGEQPEVNAGAIQSVQESMVEGGSGFERLVQDARHAVRLMRKTPGFTTTAVLTIAIGVGASAAVFSQINAVFWKTLPVDRPQELRSLAWHGRKHPFVAGNNVIAGPSVDGVQTFGSFSYPAYKAMRDGTKSFSNLACWADLGEARPVVMRSVGFGTVHFVSGNYFDTLGVRAAIGRTLTPDDDTPGTTAAVLSEPFWRRTFGARTDVLQQTIDLNGKLFSIVGVMPRRFFGVDPATIPDVIVPVAAVQLAASTVNPLQNPALWQMCRVFGRVRPGVTDEAARRDAEAWLRQAADEGATVAATMMRRPRENYDPPTMYVLDAAHGLGTLRDVVETPLLILMAVVLAILLIACANIAGLLIVRGAAREREIATRLALGASRGRIVRQLLTESLLLSAVGGLFGVVLAYALGPTSAALLSRFMPTVYGVSRPLGVAVSPDARVLLFSGAVTMITGAVFGCLPAFRSTRVALISAIKQPRAGRWSSTRLPADKVLVAVQAALSVLLIVGAGLFLRTITNLRETPLGYEPGGLLYARIEPRTGGVPSAQRAAFFERAVKRLEALPGITSVTATDNPPLGRAATIFLGAPEIRFCMAGMTQDAQRGATAAVAGVTPRYFETLRTPMVSGREFDWLDGDAGNAASVGAPDLSARPRFPAIVNETFVRRFLAGQNPLDSRFGFNCPSQPSTIQIVGVVADSKNLPRQATSARIYVPMGGALNVVTLIARTAGRPEALIATLRKAMADVNVNVPTFGEITPIELREQQMQQERLLTNLLIVFGAIALLLSSIGIYGMLAYLVTRRTSEIGIRMALGAQPTSVVAMVLRESIAPVAVGLIAGALAAVVAARPFQAFLFGVTAYDPRTMVLAVVTFLAVAILAGLLPARRAARIDPLGALRTE